ncbi:ATP-binding response regulator [Amaricoccus solimangrovi]|uniref:Response regulator n=1 Tax=Amaricoccus solimangrovi TaxID=2589815 RepID=A0A501WX39_9RHOB|nr:response regulator [Amaricoccus solimangrovi]TPE53010.1 response regulator [Amaricoccus solimangrovi]
MSIIASPFGAEPARTARARAWRGEFDQPMLAHDLRAELRGMLDGLASIDADALPREAREELERVAAAAEGVNALLGLVFEEVGAEPAEAGEPAAVNVAELLDAQRRRWTAEARRKGLSLRVVSEADAPSRVDLDPLPLARLLGHLVGEAVRHCGSGGVELVASATRRGGVLLHLSDSGPGVGQEVLERLRADAAPEGTDPPATPRDAGLRRARRLADLIPARLVLRDRAAGGFEALIELPPEICSRCEPVAPEPEADLDGARILLAEDNPTNQMVAAQMLRALRAEVTVAGDGAEALAVFEAGDFDMVVLDIEMPRVSGLDVIRRIRARGDRRANLPIVALTAYAMREHQERIAKAGANGLVSKPIGGIEQLGRALVAHLPPGFRARAPQEPGAGDPVVDQAIYDALAQAIGTELMGELVEKVIADLGAARADLETARASGDLALIRSASHILISVAGAIGAVGLQSQARAVNGLAHGRAPLDAALDGCVAEIGAVLAFLAKDG